MNDADRLIYHGSLTYVTLEDGNRRAEVEEDLFYLERFAPYYPISLPIVRLRVHLQKVYIWVSLSGSLVSTAKLSVRAKILLYRQAKYFLVFKIVPLMIHKLKSSRLKMACGNFPLGRILRTQKLTLHCQKIGKSIIVLTMQNQSRQSCYLESLSLGYLQDHVSSYHRQLFRVPLT